jgi:hypothetical protein
MKLTEFKESVNLPKTYKGFDGYSIDYIRDWVELEANLGVSLGSITERQQIALLLWAEKIIQRRLNNGH